MCRALYLGQRVEATPKSGLISWTDFDQLSICGVNDIVLVAWVPGFESLLVSGCIWLG